MWMMLCKQVVEPAIRWAEEGFFVHPGMHVWIDEPTMGRVGNLERLQYSEESARWLKCSSQGHR